MTRGRGADAQLQLPRRPRAPQARVSGPRTSPPGTGRWRHDRRRRLPSSTPRCWPPATGRPMAGEDTAPPCGTFRRSSPPARTGTRTRARPNSPVSRTSRIYPGHARRAGRPPSGRCPQLHNGQLSCADCALPFALLTRQIRRLGARSPRTSRSLSVMRSVVGGYPAGRGRSRPALNGGVHASAACALPPGPVRIVHDQAQQLRLTSAAVRSRLVNEPVK
jgi:hypothetical protein